LLCGTGLLGLVSCRPRLAVVCGIGVAACGVLTLSEYVFRVNLVIDQLLLQPSITVKTLYPGRMDLNTAVGLTLAGIALLVMSRSAPPKHGPWLAEFLGLGVLALGAVAGFGYLVDLPTAYSWGFYTDMAVHTAAGFVVLGVGLMAGAWGQGKVEAAETSRWVPTLIGIGTAVVTLYLWQALSTHEQALIKHTVTTEAVGVEIELEAEITSRLTALMRMAKRWETRGKPSQDEWEADAALYTHHYPSLQAVAWVDPALQVRWLVAASGYDTMLRPGLRLGSVVQHWAALERAWHTHAVTTVRAPDTVQGGEAVYIYVPLFQEESFDGFIAGVIRVHALLATVLERIAPDFALTVFDGDAAHANHPGRQHQAVWGREVAISLPDTTWRVQLWPTPEMIAKAHSSLSTVVLTLGLLTAVLLASVIYFAQTTRERTAALVRTNTALQNEITERQQAEAQLQRQQEALYQREKLAAMGSLLASVAHELNNPLSVVMMRTDLLHEQTKDTDLEEQAIAINQAAEHCMHIVRNFLALVRQSPPQRWPVHLNAVVEEAMQLLIYALRVDGVDLCLRLADDLPSLWADPHQLRQVVVNLVTNAQQALRETSTPRRVTLTTRFEPALSQVVLEVADTGSGIPSEIQARIFDPFFTTKPPGVGTGLGLPLCQGIIESHGGTIEVESQSGQETVFRVELPVEAVPVAASDTSAAEALAPLDMQQQVILVVDDETSIVKALGYLLRRDGHQVDTAANGRLALQKLQERSYDLILCDLRMPELDGSGLYQELAARSPHLLQRFVFLTGDTLGPETEAFLQQVGIPRLSKPFRATEVRRVVQRTLQAKERLRV
jgi:signal transduction histidine kinase/ActR/RegA family two-component response regulator